MFFKKKPAPTIRTEGYYHFKQRRKTDQGKPIQIDYSLIFRDIQPVHDEYSHFVYVNFQIDKPELDISLIRSAFFHIQQTGDCPEGFDQMLCKTEKQFVKFVDDKMIERARMGQKNVFEGMFFQDCVILRYFVFGFDYRGAEYSTIYFNDSMFKFHALR